MIAHIDFCIGYFTTLQDLKDIKRNPTISENPDLSKVKAKFVKTVMISIIIDTQLIHLILDNVLYVPAAGCNLF